MRSCPKNIDVVRPGQRHRRHLPRVDRRGVRRPRLRARHDAAGRAGRAEDTAGALPRPRAAAGQRRLGRQLDHRLLAARRPGGVHRLRRRRPLRPVLQDEFEELGIDIGNPVIVGETTGHLRLRHHAGRRADRCAPAWPCPATWPPGTSTSERIENSRWLFVEGYVFANPQTGQGAIREAIQLAKKHGVKVALTCSEAFVVDVFGDAFFEALQPGRPAVLQRHRGVRRDQAATAAGGVREAEGRGAVGGGDGRAARRLRPPRRRREPTSRRSPASRRT